MDIKKILRSGETYMYLGAAVVTIGVILLLTHKKTSAAQPEQAAPSPAPAPASAQSGTASPAKIITNFDSVYDYKFENGVWYTRKKGATSWTNMKDALSVTNYATAIAKLGAFIKK